MESQHSRCLLPSLPVPSPPPRRGIESRRDRAGPAGPGFGHCSPQPPGDLRAPLIPHPARKGRKKGWKNAAPGPGRLGEGKCCPGFGPINAACSITASAAATGTARGGGDTQKKFKNPRWGHPGGSRTDATHSSPCRGGGQLLVWHTEVPEGALGGSPPVPSRLPRPVGHGELAPSPPPAAASPAGPGPKQTGAVGTVLPSGGRVWGHRVHAGDTRG